EAFTPVKCHHFITESTFALPVYQWPYPAVVFAEINDWWRRNQAAGRTSVLFAYALGKAQRILCGVDPSIGPIGVHASVDRMLEHYLREGRPIPPTLRVEAISVAAIKGRELIVAPESVRTTNWLTRLTPYSLAAASGWMQVRGKRRHRTLDRGFILSDHADWPELLAAIDVSEASCVGVTHGYAPPLIRWLKEE